MENYKKKLIVSLLILLFAICGCAGIGFFVQSIFQIGNEYDKETNELIASIERTCDTLSDNNYTSLESYSDRILANVSITAILAGEQETEEEYGILGPFDRGYVVRLDHGQLITDGTLPFNADPLAAETTVHSESGTFRTNYTDADNEDTSGFVSYCHIRGTYYYLELHSYNEYYSFLHNQSNIRDAFNNLEYIYDTKMIIAFNMDDEVPLDDELSIYYATPSLLANEDVENCSTIGDLKALKGTVTENGLFSYHEIDEGNLFVILEKPVTNSLFDLFQQYSIQYAIIFMLATVFIVWVVSVYEFVLNHKLTELQAQQYNPKRVHRSARIIVIFCSICIFLISTFIQAAISLQRADESNSRVLDLMSYQTRTSKLSIEFINHNNQLFYIDLAQRLNDFFVAHPDKRTNELLEVCTVKSTIEFITLYDNNGNEICSSNDLINLSLSNNGDNTTAAFKPILNGVETIYAANVKEPYYSEEQDILGIRMSLPEGKYGLMLLGLPDQDDPEEVENHLNQMIKDTTPSEAVMFQIDKELNLVTHSSDPEILYLLPDSLNIKMDKLSEKNGNFYKINNINYYGLSEVGEHDIWFYMTKSSYIFKDIVRDGWNGAIQCFVVMLCLYLYLLHGYTDAEFEKHCHIGDSIARRDDLAFNPEMLTSNAKNEVKSLMYTPLKWNERMPDQKAKLVFQSFAIALLLFAGFIVTRNTSETGNIFNYLLYGNWTRGFNMFAYSSIVIMGLIVFVGISSVKMLISMLMNLMSIRTATIARLMMNFLRYVAITVFIYYTAAYLGFNPGAVLASASLIAFTVSLGSKDIVTDMVAGIMLVFESDFKVGDIIEVGNYRGTVMEIGVRTTKLIGDGNNIKSIPNKDIKNVINRTSMNSWYIMTVNIPSSIKLADIEQMFNEELPKVGEKYPEIINSPQYKGVTAIQGAKLTVTIIAEYKEKDFHKVQRTMNEEVIRILNDHDIPIG